MAWSFGDSFDLYAAVGDMLNGYWDSGPNSSLTFVAGRFSGSQAARFASNTSTTLVKSSGVNDAVHHLIIAFQQTAAISGTTLGAYMELFDGATGQCSVVFRSDGAILLTSGGPGGTVLATYTGAFPVVNTWYAFEIEVKIDSVAGSFAVRKNGNSVNDFTATSLNTRGGTANNYANKLQIGQQATLAAQLVDDLFWQSGAATGSWLGDIRCYARMPSSDQSVTFSQTGSRTQSLSGAISGTGATAGTAFYSPMVLTWGGVITSLTVQFQTYTGNTKCALFNDNAGQPGTLIASATNIVTNPAAGTATYSFSGATVAVGQKMWIGICPDTNGGAWIVTTGTAGVKATSPAYASWPGTVSGMTTGLGIFNTTVSLTVINSSLVNEPQQDGLTSYVYDSNPGDADFYGVGSIASTPATVIATVTRGYMQKSDAGTRTAAVQLKSGATTVASPTLTLSSSGWLWAWRTDLTDPNTGAAWTPAAVNNAQIGPKTVA